MKFCFNENSKITKNILRLFCVLFLHNPLAYAEIFVKGNVRITNEKIKSMAYGYKDPYIISSTLFESGFFEDVKCYERGKDIIIEVKEKTIIGDVKFLVDGKKKNIKNLLLASEIILGQTYDSQVIENAISKISNFYRIQGYTKVKLDTKFIKKDFGRCDLEIAITKGPKSRLDEVVFIGADHLSHRALRSTLSRREKSFFIFSKSSPEPYALMQDHEKIIAYAREEGFLDARIKSSFTEVDKNNNQKIYIIIEEGKRYKIAEYTIDNGSLPELKMKRKLKIGSKARSTKIEKFKFAIINAYKNKGYRVKVETEEETKDDEISIKFIVKEAANNIIERIEIGGNNLTRESVVRRLMKISEGDYYDINSIKAAKYNLLRTGFFKDVEINPEQGEKGDTLRVNLKEDKMGQIGFHLSTSFSKHAERSISLFYSHPNFMGKQHNIEVDLTLGNRSKSFNISHSVPTFFGRPFGFTSSVFGTTSGSLSHDMPSKDDWKKISYLPPTGTVEKKFEEPDESVSYTNRRVGVSFGPNFSLSRMGTLSTTLRLEKQKLKVDFGKELEISKKKSGPSNSPVAPYDEYAKIKSDQKIRFFEKDMFPKERFLPSFNVVYQLPKVDDINEPRKGWMFKSNLNLGMCDGGFWKFVNGMEGFYPLNRDRTIYFASSANYGIMGGLGGKLKWIDNFQADEAFVRGFKKHGPLEMNRFTPIGGRKFLSGMLELNAPSGLPPAWKINSFVGVYAGCVWNTKIKAEQVLSDYKKARNWGDMNDIGSDKFKLRSSLSAGIRWQLGPFNIEFYVSKPFKKVDSLDKTKKFTFTIGM